MADTNSMDFGPLADAAWLAENHDRPDVRTIDATWYLPTESKDARAEYHAAHIPGAVFVDISELRDTDHAAPHMLPTPERLPRQWVRLESVTIVGSWSTTRASMRGPGYGGCFGCSVTTRLPCSMADSRLGKMLVAR